MKRKRQTRHDQCLKELENPSTKSFRSNITGKLQTLLNGFVSELQSISEDKRQDVALLFSPKYKEVNCANSSTVKSVSSSFANSPDSTKALKNFIDSAKSRISGLLNNKQDNRGSGGDNLLKHSLSSTQSKTKSLSIDPLEIQISLKFQSLLFKAFDTKKANRANGKQEITTSKGISEKDWHDLSRMLQDFSQSAKKKLRASLTKEKNSQSLNGSVSIQNSPVKESQSSCNTKPSAINQRKGQNKESQKHSGNQQDIPSCSLANDSSELIKTNPKLLKMDYFSDNTDSSSSPRNPYEEGCMLLLSDAEKCPAYIDLNLSSDSDEHENPFQMHTQFISAPQLPVQKSESESEDDVVVLGVKSKTYQEVTLEEDDEGQVHESVVEKVLEKHPKKEKEAEEPMYNCRICDKKYRASSLLQFHIKMHASESYSSNASENHCLNSSSSSEDESSSIERPVNLSHRKLGICKSQDALVSQKDLGSNNEFNILNEKSSETDDKSLRKVKKTNAFYVKRETFTPEKFPAHHSSNETSFIKDKDKVKLSLSSFGQERFLQIERCPDNPDLSMLYDWENLNSGVTRVKEEHSHKCKKFFGHCESSKSSAVCKNLESEGATLSQAVVGFLEGPIERCPEYPNLSMVYDWKSFE